MAADDYKHLPRRGQRRGKRRAFLFGVALGLGLGLTLGLAFGLGLGWTTATARIAKDKAAAPTTETASGATAGTAAAEEATTRDAAPSPRFDFYRILPGKKEINISEWPAGDESAADAAGGGETYMVQVGSFNSRAAAETVKAELALLGLRAQIQDVVIRGLDVRYRVRLGPYTSMRDLKATRRRLSENRFEHIVKRLQTE